MKIFHAVDEPYDSGIVHYALTLAATQARRGHDVKFIALKDRFPFTEAARLGLSSLGLPHPLWLGLIALRRTIRKDRPDLIVAHTGSAHTLSVAACAGRRSKVLRTRADARPMQSRPGRKLLWKRTSGFVAANRRILENFSKLYGSLELPAQVIYQGMEDPGPAQPPLEGPLVVGIVGRLDPVKGQKVFIQACARVHRHFPHVRFVVIGREENVKAKELQGLAQELGLEKCLQLSGHVPDVLESMRRCHIGVIASTNSEAVSRVAVEWMSLGRPLIATSVGCLPEYIHEEMGFLVPPEDAELLALCLDQLLANSELRARMGRQARKRYEALFTLERFQSETERFYEQTLHAVSS